jgi:hypothetical protein
MKFYLNLWLCPFKYQASELTTCCSVRQTMHMCIPLAKLSIVKDRGFKAVGMKGHAIAKSYF